MTYVEFIKQMPAHGPVLVGTYLVCKAEAGSRIDAEKGGAKVAFAMIEHSIEAGRKVWKVKQSAKGLEEVAKVTEAVGNDERQDALAPVPRYAKCWVAISSIKNDKGAITVNGKVHPFDPEPISQSGAVAGKTKG